MIKLKRISNRPILSPKKESTWEAGAVFNCGAVYSNGLVHVIYRATDGAPVARVNFTNNLGYAVSVDGIEFNRLEKPILINDVDSELIGPEDPRIVKLKDTFYMMYTAYSGKDYRIALASSKNLIDWQRRGIVLDERNKDASLFPEMIDGRYLMLHRREPDIWLSYSDDLQSWYDHRVIMRSLPDSDWENVKIGIAGPPFRTDAGWFLLYHGVDRKHRYCLGAALLDPDDPSKVISRQADPVLEPELEWEINGHVPNVVFACGQVELVDRILVYYGAADTCIGVAEIKKKDILSF